MPDPRTAAKIETARRAPRNRRARRGVVAGYIHSLSARHDADVRRAEPPTPAVAAATREA